MAGNRLIEAAHLARRTGFGPTMEEIQALAALSHQAAVRKILDFDGENNANRFDLLARLKARGTPYTDWGQPDLQQAWIDIMRETPSPLQEKMALFWHNHFTSAYDKVDDIMAMIRQNDYFRRHALGNFARMTHDMAVDTAMLVYLDGIDNSKDAPNENFARELMELFTIGRGYYSEHDVREAARAFTGWEKVDTADNTPIKVTYNPDNHDDSLKTFLGRSGNFTGDDIIDIILARPETAYALTHKFWEFFIYPQPTYRQIKRIGDMFFSSDYDCRVLLELILLDEEFLSPRAYRANIKSPVEIVVGAARTLGAQQVDASVLYQMGQSLFNPRNVRGWLGGRHWINSASLLARLNYNSALLTPDGTVPAKLPLLSTIIAPGTPPTAQTFAQLATLFVDNQAEGLADVRAFLNAPWQSDATNEQDRRDEYAARLRGLVHLLMCFPEYQLN